MWRLADRAVKAMADVTVGTVIVLVHVALAERGERGERGDHGDRGDRGDRGARRLPS